MYLINLYEVHHTIHAQVNLIQNYNNEEAKLSYQKIFYKIHCIVLIIRSIKFIIRNIINYKYSNN